MIPAIVYTSRLFPVYATDEDFLSRAETVAQQQAAPVVRKTLLGRSDALRRMLRSRASAPGPR
jgi:aminopeptidase N